jgi:hypothetical protein
MTQLQKSLADSRRDIRDLTVTIGALDASVATLSAQVTGLVASLREQEAELTRVRCGEAQLRAVAERNLELEGHPILAQQRQIPEVWRQSLYGKRTLRTSGWW